MKREDVLSEAAKCVCTDRNDDYGVPEDNFSCIGDLWSSYLGFSPGFIKSRDVAAMMALLKIARIRRCKKADNWVDLAGYAACGGEIDDREPETAG